MKKLILGTLLLLLPTLLSAQSVKYAIYGNAADTSSAVVIDPGHEFLGLMIPDDINSDAITFLVSRDGTNYYKLQRVRAGRVGLGTAVDSTAAYTLIPGDTSAISFTPLPEEVFNGIRMMQIILDAATSSAQDTIEVTFRKRLR